MNGYLAAGVAVLIAAAYPVATRAGMSSAFTPQELVVLRFGIGGLLFLPYLAFCFRSIPRAAWQRGLALTVFQGAGMGMLVIFGLQLAPASHAAALGPGVNPAWVAFLGFMLFARRPSLRVAAGAALCAGGVIGLTLAGMTALDRTVLLGDAMFLAASALGALYVLHLRKWGIGAVQGAAIVSLYSALIVVPWHLASAPEAFAQVRVPELLWQVLWQGVLIGCVALLALNQAIARLGVERSSALVALVPVLSAALALVFLGELPSAAEIAAFVVISAGVSVAAARERALPTPVTRLSAVPPRSA